VLEHICGTIGGNVVGGSSMDCAVYGNLRSFCIIGENCKIDESASIGPNVSIGDDTIISSDVVIENSIIMSGCKIDGGLNIKDSIISANCHLHGNNKDKTKKIFLLGEGTKITL
jgi:NDP-sugar pyrophosphorylase family protein